MGRFLLLFVLLNITLVSLGENNFSARLEVRTNGDLLFIILTSGEDRSGLFTNIYDNAEYPDGSLELPLSGNLLRDDKGVVGSFQRNHLSG